ncbi:SHOCT domain-containing protein [Ursidibacter arcticus]
MGRISKGLELERLEKLRNSGVLSEKEFQSEKRKLLYGEKRSGCLKPILIGISVFAAYMIFSDSGNKQEIDSPSPAQTYSLSDNTPNQRECEQVSKDLFYFYKVNAFCRNQLNMSEFNAGFGDKVFFEYRDKLGCPSPSVEESKKLADIIETAVSKGIEKSGSLKIFCQNEIPYFTKIANKYGS